MAGDSGDTGGCSEWQVRAARAVLACALVAVLSSFGEAPPEGLVTRAGPLTRSGLSKGMPMPAFELPLRHGGTLRSEQCLGEWSGLVSVNCYQGGKACTCQ